MNGTQLPADGPIIFGPYLRGSSFPSLPVCANKGQLTVKVVVVAPTYQITGEGWVYDNVSGALMANCDTDADEATTLYNTY